MPPYSNLRSAHVKTFAAMSGCTRNHKYLFRIQPFRWRPGPEGDSSPYAAVKGQSKVACQAA